MIVTEAAAPPAAGRWELFRALGAVAGDPADARTACAALGWAGPDNAEHTEVFVLNCPPYAAVYLGAEGGLGGDAADRAAGFWRAIGLAPPAEPDHLAALFGLYASLGEAADGARTAATADVLTRARHALFWEHLWPWLPGYLDTVADLRAPGLAPWARLARRALLAERGAHPRRVAAAGAARRAGTGPGPGQPGSPAGPAHLPGPQRFYPHSPQPGRWREGGGCGLPDRRTALHPAGPAGTGPGRHAELAGRRGRALVPAARRAACRAGRRAAAPNIVQAWWARRAGHTARILAMTAR